MVSGVSFNNPQSQKPQKKKRSVASASLVIVFLLLVAVIATYGILLMINGGLKNKITSLDQSITQQQDEIDAAAASVAGTVVKKVEIEKRAFADASTDMMLTQFQDMMVPQIVLKTFDHSYIISEKLHRISLTADANNFDVMAAQVKVWKENPIFARVSVGESDRDDEGRIVFSAEFDLAENVMDGDAMVPAVTTQQAPPTQEVVAVEEAAQEAAEDSAQGEGAAESAPQGDVAEGESDENPVEEIPEL